MPKIEDLTGQRFGMLTVTGRAGAGTIDNGHARWWCDCDCGQKCISNAGHLKGGKKKSCGCLQRAWNDSYKKRMKSRSTDKF